MHLTTPLDNMTDADRRDARTFSRAMLLEGGAVSAEGAALVARIVDRVISPHKAAVGQLRPSSVTKYRVIAAPFLADLLIAAKDGVWCNLSTNTNAIKKLPGGKEAFRTMREAMGTAGLLEELRGFKTKATDKEAFAHRSARTSFRPTPRLLKMAEDDGVPLAGLGEHFARGAPSVPKKADMVEARASVPKGEQPQRVPIDVNDPKAASVAAGVQRLNDHLLAEGRIGGIAFAGLRRIFNNADHPDFDWQWGGRHYSMPGADAYWKMPGGVQSRLRAIRIDGAEVAAVDIRASHFTILHGLLRLPMGGDPDPYMVPDVDRDRVKDWLLLALGSSDAAAGGRRCNKPRAAMLDRYPFLANLPGLGIGTLDLQYHEAEVMRLAMEDLMSQSVGFLPVFDELMVARANQGRAQAALRDAFRRHFVDALGHSTAPIPRLSVVL